MNRRSAAREFGEVVSQLLMIVVVKAFDGRVPDRTVHSFDLTIRPGVVDLGQPVVDLMFPAVPVEDAFEGVDVPVVIGELDAPRHWA